MQNLAPVVHPAGGALAAHDRLPGEAAHAEGEPLEAVAELGAHYVVQDGVDGLESEGRNIIFMDISCVNVKTAYGVNVIHEATEGDDVEVGLVADDIGDNLHRAHHHPESEDLKGMATLTT